MQLIICVVLCVAVICLMIYMNKRTAAKLYAELVQDSTKPDSPYGISRECNSDDVWGYCITKNGEVMYSANRSRIFGTIKLALKEVNALEAVQGYKKTRVEL